MAAFIPSSIQKRLLRYALSHTGLLDTDAIDLQSLDITLGKRNIVELRDVGIRTKKLASLLQLPPTICLTTARVLLLRLTVPADIYRSSILAEVEGIELRLNIQRDHSAAAEGPLSAQHRRPESSQSPQHRKTNRRSQTPHPFDPGGNLEGGVLPSTRDLAKTFLLDEPAEERRALEAAVAGHSKQLDESTLSESSEESSYGTGVGLALPGFLSGFLQGIVDRFTITVKDVRLTLDADLKFDGKDGLTKSSELTKVSFNLSIGDVDVERVIPPDQSQRVGKRYVLLKNIIAEIATDAEVLASLSRISSQAPPAESLASRSSTGGLQDDSALSDRPLSGVGSTERQGNFQFKAEVPTAVLTGLQSSSISTHTTGRSSRLARIRHSLHESIGSISTLDPDRFADAGDDGAVTRGIGPGPETSLSESGQLEDDLDILPGEDTFSWAARRDRIGDRRPRHHVQKSRAGSDIGTHTGTHRLVSEEDDRNFARSVDECSKLSESRYLQNSGSQIQRRQPAATSPDVFAARLRHSQAQDQQSETAAFRSHSLPFRNALDEPEVDNKRHAIKVPESYNADQGDAARTGSEGTSPDNNALAESQLFTHKEAESMYMSAMTNTPVLNSTQRGMPGGWNESSVASGESETSLLNQLHSVPEAAGFDITLSVEDPLSTPRPRSRAGTIPTRHNAASSTASPGQSSFAPDAVTEEHDPLPPPEEGSSNLELNPVRTSKRVLTADRIGVCLPRSFTKDEPDVHVQAQASTASKARPAFREFSESRHQGMPGGFSQYADVSASRRRRTTTLSESSMIIEEEADTGNQTQQKEGIEVDVDSVVCEMDVSIGQLLFRLLQQVQACFVSQSANEPMKSTPQRTAAANQPTHTLRFRSLSLALFEYLEDRPHLGMDVPQIDHYSDALAKLDLKTVHTAITPGTESPDVDLTIGTLSVSSAGQTIVFFDKSASVTASVRNITDMTDLRFLLSQSKTTVRDTPVTQVELNTLPMKLLIDLPHLEETFSSFGGLSAMLEMSSSITSGATLATPSTLSGKAARGVHFAATPSLIAQPPDTIVRARIGGTAVQLIGRSCSLTLNTRSVKLSTLREKGSYGIATGEATVIGPLLPSNIRQEPAEITIRNPSVTYFSSPGDADLERLLPLLTPSKDKYDNDDDILIDTFMRQRRKGSLLEVDVEATGVRICNWDFLDTLAAFEGEFNKLSAVTKYLPEDERPGMLTLVRLARVEARVPLNESLGFAHIACHDLEVAHVGLPSLVAFAIGSVHANRDGEAYLIHDLVEISPSYGLPMIMGRMIGDEVEPSIKIKLFNVCAEYRVSTIAALMGVEIGINAEQIVADLAASVATLSGMRPSPPAGAGSESSSSSVTSQKTLHVDLLLHDCALGLNPDNSPAKGLFMLVDSRFCTLIPPKRGLSGTFEVRKASFLLVDDQARLQTKSAFARPSQIPLPRSGGRLTAILTDKGYVSICSIMSAKVKGSVKELPHSDIRPVEIDFKDALIVVEACADSFQTLATLAGGLQPPMPPSKQPKYRMEAITVEDMMASFSGEAFARPQPPSSPLFDAEEESAALENSTSSDPEDDFLTEADMTGSLIGPLEDMFDEGAEEVETASSKGETSESFLEEEDFFVIPEEQPKLTRSGLLRALCEQTGNTKSKRVLGTASRFRTPATPLRGLDSINKDPALPFRVTVQKVHVIFNLHDGYDWPKTREAITAAVVEVETKVEQRKQRRQRSQLKPEDEDSVIGDCLFNSIYIGVPAMTDNTNDLRRQINRNIDDVGSETESYATSGISKQPSQGSAARPQRAKPVKRLRLERSRAHKASFELKGLYAELKGYPPGSGETQVSIAVTIEDLEVFDNVPTSTWRKFLTYQHDAENARELAKPMVDLRISNVKPIPDLSASELVIRVSILPIRLHVDQDALDFITRFFEFKDTSVPVAEKASEQPFLQRVEVDAVHMLLDYKPKTIDYASLRSGHTTEFMNIIGLDSAKITLKHAIVYGITLDALHQTLNDLWMPDVKRNQLSGILGSLAPVRGIVNLGAGIRDVVAIPVREYQRDGRIVRSIQKGAFHFARTTTSELARLGAKLAVGTQT
ncbi:autophagy-related protein 2, partial [Elasticomyces elasticus]